jgi:hypothetical protein
MDYLKTEAPFWKKRHVTGESAGDWVEAKAQDHAAAQKWRVQFSELGYLRWASPTSAHSSFNLQISVSLAFRAQYRRV